MITAEYLRSILDYNPETGDFTWKTRLSASRGNGQRAGYYNTKKALRIGIGKKVYLVQRLAWLYHYGVFPKGKLKFLDGNSLNCRISNLAEREKTKFPDRKAWIRHISIGNNLKYHHGLSLSQLQQMVDEQDGKCSICDQPERRIYNGKVRRLSVDHDHATGKIRALLCTSCNTMIGLAGENTNILARAIEYLTKHKEKNSEAA